MLILTRREREVVTFPDLGIRIVVVALDGNRVKLGIEADKSVRVFREEAYRPEEVQ